MINKPDVSSWLFDNSIKINKKKNTTNDINYSTKKVSYKNIEIVHIKFNNLSKNNKFIIISNLVSCFGKTLDINSNTYIHYIKNNKDNTIIAIACTNTDENIEKIYRSQGWKLKDTIGIKANGIYLYNLFVSKVQQNKGYGKFICNNIIELYKKRNCNSIHVQIKDNNIISTNLFIKLKFLKENSINTSQNSSLSHYTRWL